MSPDLLPSDEYRTMAAEAERRGFSSARALRDWCKRNGVPYVRDGKINWVRSSDIQAAVLRLAASPAPEEPDDLWLEAAVARTKARRRKP